MLKVVDIPEIGDDASVDCLGRVTIPIGMRRKYNIFPSEKSRGTTNKRRYSD